MNSGRGVFPVLFVASPANRLPNRWDQWLVGWLVVFSGECQLRWERERLGCWETTTTLLIDLSPENHHQKPFCYYCKHSNNYYIQNTTKTTTAKKKILENRQWQPIYLFFPSSMQIAHKFKSVLNSKLQLPTIGKYACTIFQPGNLHTIFPIPRQITSKVRTLLKVLRDFGNDHVWPLKNQL